MPLENNESPKTEEMTNNIGPMPKPHPQPNGPQWHCHCKHKGAKLVAALLIFLAGFGLAMMCRCMKHSHAECPHNCAMMKKHAMVTPNYTDGAGNVIIINTDGSKPAMHKYNQQKKAQPTQMQQNMHQPQATLPMQPNIPMIDNEDFAE